MSRKLALKLAALGAWLLAAVLLVAYVSVPRTYIITEGGTPTMQPVARQVSRANDTGKAGQMRSVMGQHRFSIAAATSAPSPDRLDFRFDAPAEILGVLVSVDDRNLAMTEMAVGIDAHTYGIHARDWLIHTSATGKDTDEQVWFAEPFIVGPDNAVSVVAWLYNEQQAETWVSPEVIVYYRWITSPPAA